MNHATAPAPLLPRTNLPCAAPCAAVAVAEPAFKRYKYAVPNDPRYGPSTEFGTP